MDKVILYSTNSCGYCKLAKMYFEKNNIIFIEKKVDSDNIARAEFEKYNVSGVPLIVVNGKVIRGFDKATLDTLLKKPIIECPKCRTSLRVPKDKGIILVTCSKCKSKFKVNTTQL